jgi:hypothetical protein
MTSLRSLTLFLAVILSASTANANDRPLIWTPVKNSSESYAMRMGSRLPTDWEASAGTEVSFAGSNLERVTRPNRPVNFWGSVKLPSPRGKAATNTADVSVRLNGLTGSRSVSVSRSRSLTLTPEFAAQLDDFYTLNYDHGGDRRIDMRTTSSVRILSTSTGTSIFARGSRSTRDQEWQASVGVEQKVLTGINLRANIDNLAARHKTGSFGASYAHKW